MNHKKNEPQEDDKMESFVPFVTLVLFVVIKTPSEGKLNHEKHEIHEKWSPAVRPASSRECRAIGRGRHARRARRQFLSRSSQGTLREGCGGLSVWMYT